MGGGHVFPQPPSNNHAYETTVFSIGEDDISEHAYDTYVTWA